MQIGFNCIACDASYSGGVNTYTLGLLKGFKEILSDEDQLHLFVTKTNAKLFEAFRSHPRFKFFTVMGLDAPVLKGLFRLSILPGRVSLHEKFVDRLFLKVRDQMSRNSDLIYTPTTVSLPYRFDCPSVVSMHDAQHEHFPEFFSWNEMKSRTLRFKTTSQVVTSIQASSQFIKNDLLRLYPALSPDQVFTIHEGVDIDKFKTPTPLREALQKKYRLESPFLFFPAQLWPHKNHITVLRALDKLKRDGLEIPLILTGASYSAAPEIFKFKEDHKLTSVFYLGRVSEEELVCLYQMARAIVAPALYESSSLPILEAAAAGTAIVAASTPPNLELAAKLQMSLFNTQDADDLAKTLKSLWNFPEQLEPQIQRNSISIQDFSWAEVARKYRSVFERLINYAKAA